MRNNFETTIQLKRIDICDLMLACSLVNNGRNTKWKVLHDKLQDQLDKLDGQLDDIIKNELD